MLGAALEGMGLAQVPEPIAVEEIRTGKLIEVLASFAPKTPGVFLYYPGHRQMTPKLRAFIDHMSVDQPGCNGRSGRQAKLLCRSSSQSLAER